MSAPTIERRTVPGNVETRQVGGKTVVSGYAAVFNVPSSNLGGFVERIAATTFNKTLADRAPVRCYRNHNVDQVLASITAQTLRLAVDGTGLHYEYDSPSGISYARDLEISIERGDCSTSSFAFSVVGPDGESWGYTADDFPLRTLNEARLYDVSPITGVAAYGDATSIGFSKRSLEALCVQRGIDPTAFGDVDPDVTVRAILDGFEVAPATSDDVDPTEERHTPNLSLYRARLKLVERANWVA